MKKSYRLTFTILLTVGVIFLAIGLIAPQIVLQLYVHDYDVGYIAGGIDFPDYTDILFNHLYGIWAIFVFMGSATILSSAFALIFHKLVSKTCGVVTAIHSLALSVFGSAGLVFALLTISTAAFDVYYRYPNANPAFFACGIICLVICNVLLISYFIQWYKKASFRGLLLETLLTIVYFPAFFWFSGVLVDFLWDILKNYI